VYGKPYRGFESHSLRSRPLTQRQFAMVIHGHGSTLQRTSPQPIVPYEPVLGRPALDHGDLVGIGLAVGVAAALHDGAVAGELDGDPIADHADGMLAGERPDRARAKDAALLVGRDTVRHAAAFAGELLARPDLAEAPDRRPLPAAIDGVGQGMAVPASAGG